MLEIAEIKPQIIQVEGHPYFQQAALKERVKPYGTRMEHWFPLTVSAADITTLATGSAMRSRMGRS